MSFLDSQRTTIKSYLTENNICKLSIVAYSDGIMEVIGQIYNIFATGNVQYWTSMENPIKPLQFPVINTYPDAPNDDNISVSNTEPYFNVNMNKGNTNISNGQFKFTTKYTSQGEYFKLPSDPIYIHMIVSIDGHQPVNIDIKMDMNVPIRFIDTKQPQFNSFIIQPDNKKKSTFYDGYKDHEYYERRQQFRDQNKPNYADRAMNLIDLPNLNQEYFGMPAKNAPNTMNNFTPDVDFRRTKNVDLTPFDPFGR